jgi:hypothetical protein
MKKARKWRAFIVLFVFVVGLGGAAYVLLATVEPEPISPLQPRGLQRIARAIRRCDELARPHVAGRSRPVSQSPGGFSLVIGSVRFRTATSPGPHPFYCTGPQRRPLLERIRSGRPRARAVLCYDPRTQRMAATIAITMSQEPTISPNQTASFTQGRNSLFPSPDGGQ